MASQFNLPNQYKKYYQQLEPMLAKPKTRTYSTVIFFFLVVALFGWYAIRPTIQTILYLRREIIDKKEINEKMDTKINALIQAQALLENVQTKLPLAADAIPQNPEAIDVVRVIRDLASQAGASISAIQVSAVPVIVESSASASSKAFAVKNVEFSITASIEGTYQTLSSFFTNLISMRRVFVIDSLTFSTNKSSQTVVASPLIQLNMKVLTYYQTL